MRRIEWTSPAPEAVRTRQGTILFFGEGAVPDGAYRADPVAVRRWIVDEYEEAVAMHSQVAREMNDLTGNRGYPRAKEGVGEVDGGAAGVFGATERESQLAATWRRGRFGMVNDCLVPWFWPAMRVIHGLRKRGLRKSAASLRACMEGGWLTQWKLWAEGRAGTSKCGCGSEAGTLWHKLAACPMGEEGRKTARKPSNLPELIAQGRAHVWDPLFSRGVPARPKFPPPPRE